MSTTNEFSVFMAGGSFSDVGDKIRMGEAEFKIIPDRHFDTNEIIPNAYFIQCEGVVIAGDMPSYSESANYIERLTNEIS